MEHIDDAEFKLKLDDYIMQLIQSHKSFEVKHVSQLVTLLVTYKQSICCDTLFDELYNYIIIKIKEYAQTIYDMAFQPEEFKKSFDICIKLAVMKMKNVATISY